ncbi:MAG TPA: FAD-dependent monooxygenase [Ramlibacter sp.]|uniref:FAD-dependent monooxygenase n=1 Tax=Ramlibacter sp. TaxID=1917967 RepID=UPI002CB23365|nr:FAD-dependent monooxygenase [Ramlibacter sp.]HVZ45799.1 FAD-dependent monooxygenase [Ramlibacter sp.]
MNSFDVVIAGAGPVGLVLAIDLGRKGVRTLLLERDAETKAYPKMDRSNARTMELFRRLGLADRVRALGYPADASMDVFIVTRLADEPILRLRYPTVAEHRAAIAACKDASEPLEPYQLVSQNDLEPMLKEVAEATPNVTVRFGCALAGFSQDAEGVQVHLQPSGSAPEQVRSRYLVGCDGATSLVRKTLGIPLQGRGSLRSLRQVTFRSETLYEQLGCRQGRHYYFADGGGGAIVVQGSRKEFTMNAALPEDADLEQAVREHVGFDFDFRITATTSWKHHLLLAERYREGRVFIAGDAAHLMIPTGGLGMNTGVGDAVDLAWKLAGTVHGWGGPGLLASYEIERRKVGARNVEAAGWAAAGVGMWRSLWKPQVSHATAEGAALRSEIALAADLHHRRVHEMAGVELGYSYAGSPLISSETGGGDEWETTRYRPHTRPGVRLPHVWLADGRAMQDALGDGYTLLDLDGRLRADELAEVHGAFAALGAPFDVVQLHEPHVREVFGFPLLLLRPDLHVYWRGHAMPASAGALARAATGHSGANPGGGVHAD